MEDIKKRSAAKNTGKGLLITPQKSLLIEVPHALHHDIKAQAAWRNQSIRKYIIDSVVERMKKDAQYE